VSPSAPSPPARSRRLGGVAFLVLALLVGALRAGAETTPTFEITGSFAPAAQGITVLVQLRSRAASPVASVRVEGEWRGERVWAYLAGPFSPGGFGEVRLHFAQTPPPGTHALVLLFDFARTEGMTTAWVHEATALLLAFDALPKPAVRMALAPLALTEWAEAAVGLQSADGQPHRVRLSVRPPRMLACDPAVQTVEVPARGRVDARVRVFRARAEPGRQELVAVAATTGEPETRTTLAALAVDVAPVRPWLPRARTPLLLAAGAALLWTLYKQYRNAA
jgi:hypothetical protein